jgi:hypothetical protein
MELQSGWLVEIKNILLHKYTFKYFLKEEILILKCVGYLNKKYKAMKTNNFPNFLRCFS